MQTPRCLLSPSHFTREETEAQGNFIICPKASGVFIPKGQCGWWKARELGCLDCNFFFFCSESSVSSSALSECPVAMVTVWGP